MEVAENMTDGNASFLRAARAGNLEKVIEYLKGNIDINTSNANGLNALHLAAKEGHVNVVTELLKRGANVNAATKKGNTALHIASLAGQEEVVRVLVQLGANVNVQSQNGFTPLYMAAQENHDSVVSFLLANGANQSLATEDGFTPLAVALQQGHDKVVAVLLENDTKGRVRLPALHIAAKKDDCKAATLLLQSDHNPDVTSKSGFTPLHIAAHYGNENIAKILLSKGADVNYAAKHQITPLHVASKWGKMNMVVLLLENGANIEAATRDGLTPLHCAARSGHDQVVDLLLEKGAPFLAKTKNGLAPLHMASQGDHVDSARILLYHKAPVDDVTVDYLTALHVAAHCGHVKVAKLLLDRKADPNARALNGFTPLHIACKKNRIKVVELLLKHGASIEATTESGLTPLHVASFMGCMNIVIYLIQNGANPDVPTVRGETPLHLAARANQTDIIRILLRNGASVDARAREEQTPLHIAARLGNVDIVSLLLQHGAAVDATTKDMYTALHIAAKEDQEEVASALLDHGASLTSTTKKGFTPLHLAAKYGNIKVARLLLQKGAPVDAQGKNGVTPLHVAAHYDHVNVALLLLEKGASPHAMAKNGYTPLHIAAKKNQMDIASTLLEYGAKTNSESKAGFTPLHLSSQEGHADMSLLLIDHKADVNHKANNGLTPLHLCAQDDRVNVATVLVKHGAEIGPQTKAGYTPLHVASHFGQINMVRFLLQHDANVHTTTSHGYTPLHQAAQQGHTLVVNLLLENQASPNVTTMQGQTPLSIAQRLGYISVVETLKVVTETTVTTTTTTVTEEKYKVVAPETMQETFMTDSEDEGGADFDEAAIFGKPTHATHVYLPYVEGQNFQMSEEAMLGDQSYRYISADELKSLGDDSLPIDVTKDEKQHDVMQSVKQFGAPMVEEDNLSPQHVTPVESGFVEKFSPDNIDLTRVPVHAGSFSWDDDYYYSFHPKGMLRSSRLKWKTFLVSFMVDARGGAMRGCRHSGVRVIIPPRKASMPMRITCRYLRKEKLIHPPPLMEGEACASRILEMGPVGARFLGPVIIEVPHFASTRGKEREITILRSDTGENWREHTLEASEEAVQEVLNESFEGEELSALEDLNTNRITRILTTDFPQYFAIVTRVRQEVHGVGPEGGMVSSTVVPQVQAIFPEGALTKKIRVGLQAQPIAPELVAKLLGNRVAVSPIVTVEPRRRKFHKPITLTIPVPQAATKGMINQYSGDAPTLRLLCSITGSTKSGGSSKAQWEDVTGSTPLTFVNDCVSFTTTVSARFWLMDCRQVPEVTRYATELYQEAVYVPFMSKFVIFAKRHDPYEAQLRVFCMTDDKEDKTLESQEHFTEVAKSRDVEVLEGKLQYLEFAGNLVPVTKSGEQLKLTFQAFHENRLPFIVRVKDPHIEPMGRIAFMKEPKTARGEPPQVPICNLNVVLPDITPSELNAEALEMVTLEKRYDYIQEAGLSKPELIHRADLRLSDIARELGKDWLKLAQQLDVAENDIEQIKAETTYDQSEQALMMLRLWLQKSGSKATGNELEKGLRKINREDIIKNCMFNVELVTDDVEKAVAKVHLDQSGFDVFKEELGSSREASMRRGASLDISYDEQDIMKEAESAAETSSETGSLFERDQLSQALTDDKDVCQTDVVGTQSSVNDSIIPADKITYISPSIEQCESSGPSTLKVNNLSMQSDPIDTNDNIHVSPDTQSVQTFENKINNTTYNNELENVVNGSNNYILKTEQSSKKLHEFWPPDKVPETNHSIVYSMQESSDIKSSPFILDDSVSNNSFNKESSSELRQNKKNEIMDPNINLSNIIGDNIENSNAYLNANMNVSEYDKPISKEISTNGKPMIDPSEKDALDNDKTFETNDLGYCSLDKDINDSSNLMTDNIRHENSLPSEIVSDECNLGHKQTPSCDSFDKEVLLENTDFHSYSTLHPEKTISATYDTILENTYDNSERNSSLKELQEHEEMPNVFHSTPEATAVSSVSTEVNILQSDENIVTTENSSQSINYADKNTEISTAEDAKIRRPSKTPPPSPADEIDKVYGNIEKEKDVLAATVITEVKDAHVRLSDEIEIRPVEGAGEVGGQELLARLTESETWPSGDLDTSQVSVSSLPDDEKSEPTTATVSSAAATAVDDRSTAVSETVEKTQDDGCGITTHIIQKTTHMTISVQEKPEEEFDDKKQLGSLISEVEKLDTDKNLVSEIKQEAKEEERVVCSVDKSEQREQDIVDEFQAGKNVLREPFETSIGQLAEEAAITSVVSGDTVVKAITEQSIKTIEEQSKPVESAVSSIGDIVSTSPEHELESTKISFPADESELSLVHPLSSTKTDMKVGEEHVQDRNVEITFEQDEFVHELKTTDLKHEQYIQPIREFESELIPCAFVNTAFAGAELIDEVEQSASIRARSPYEVVREEQSLKCDQREEISLPEETDDIQSKVNFISRHTDIHRRPILQHIPSEISEEDLVEREITSPTRQEFEVFGEDEIRLSEIAFHEASSQSSQDLVKDELSREVETVHSKKGTTTIVNGNIVSESVEEICSSPQTTRIVTTTVKKTVIKTISEFDASGSGMNGEDAVARKLSPHEIELKIETSEFIAKTDDATTPESDTGIPTSPFEVLSESELSDGEHRSAHISVSPNLPKSSSEKSHDSVIMTTHSQSFTDKTISASISKDFSDSETLNEKSQCEELQLQSEAEAALPAKLPSAMQGASDEHQKLDATCVSNGPGEVDYHKEYDYDSEFPPTVSYEDKYIFDDMSCTEPRAHEIRDFEEVKKSRYSSISDDGVDLEINEILRSEQQLEDIIERPVTPEPPKDELPNIAYTEKLGFDLSLPCAAHEDDYTVSDDGDQIVSSPGFSPDDSKARFAYGIEFEKEILDVPEEAMDIDSDQYSEEKESSYAYAMRFERDPELDEEDIPCYGDLYTHEEEDEDALENGDKIKIVSKPDKDPEFDILAGRKYFSKNVELDDLSMSSLQEFERLEAEIVSGRKSSIGSLDSLNGKPPVSKSGEHDDVSMSSLTEFERLERECTESEKIDPAMQESITQLSEIEEGHESQASETSQENKSDVGKEEDLSIVEDYSNQLESIEEIMLEAKDELPFQYLIKKTQIIDKPYEGKAEEQTTEAVDVQSSGTKIKDCVLSSSVEVHTSYKTSETTYLDPSGKTQDNDFNKNVRDDDLDQDSLHDDQDSLQQMLSLKPDSLTEDIKHEFQDSLREEKFDDADSLQGEIPDEMRDSLLEERHIEDDSLRDMDILPDESSLSLESSIAAVISHDSSKTDDHVKVKDQNGAVHEVNKRSSLGSTLESFMTIEKAYEIASHSPIRDFMLSSTDSLEQSTSAAAYHLETDTAMSSSLNSAITSEDYTMISSTDTLEQEGRITFRYEDIPVDELEVIVKDGRQVIVDSEGNIQAQYDAKHYIGAEDNVNNALSFSSKDLSTVEHPSTSTVQVHSAVTTVSYIGEPQKFQSHKTFHSAADQGTSDSEYESSHFDPDVEVEEIHTTDEFGNPKVIKKIRRVIQTKTQYSSSSSSQNVEEKLKEFLKEHTAGENAGCGEEEIKEERTVDDKGNVVLIRTVQQQILSEPQVHSRTFRGPDADAHSREFIETFQQLDPTENVCEYEKIDEQGNVVRVTQQVVVKPEMHTVSFSGPDAHKQMEEYMKQWTAMSQGREEYADDRSPHLFQTTHVSSSREEPQEYMPSEGLGCDVTDGRTVTKTIVSSFPPESSEQMVVHTTTTTRTSVSSFGTEDEPPSDSKDQMEPSKHE